MDVPQWPMTNSRLTFFSAGISPVFLFPLFSTLINRLQARTCSWQLSLIFVSLLKTTEAWPLYPKPELFFKHMHKKSEFYQMFCETNMSDLKKRKKKMPSKLRKTREQTPRHWAGSGPQTIRLFNTTVSRVLLKPKTEWCIWSLKNPFVPDVGVQGDHHLLWLSVWQGHIRHLGK